MMMHLLNKKYAGMDTDFNWGKYAFNQFLKHVEAFEPKIVDGLAEPKANMHFGIRICYLLEQLGVTLREHRDIPMTNSLFRYAFEEKKVATEKAQKEVKKLAVVQQEKEVTEQTVAKPPVAKRKRSQRASKSQKAQDAPPSGDRVSEDASRAERPLQKVPRVTTPIVPEMSQHDRNIIDESAPIGSDSDNDLVLTETLKKSRIETHGGASASAP